MQKIKSEKLVVNNIPIVDFVSFGNVKKASIIL